MAEKSKYSNRVREALGRIYDHYPPYFREYLRRFQEDPTSRVFAPLAEAYRRLGRVDDALDICQDGIARHPDFYGGRVVLAKCFIDKQMYNQAKEELERVVQAVPENLLAQRLLGDVGLALKDKELALHSYKMALLLSPHDVSLSERVSLLESQQGEITLWPFSSTTDKKSKTVLSSDGIADEIKVFEGDFETPSSVSLPLETEPVALQVESEPITLAEPMNETESLKPEVAPENPLWNVDAGISELSLAVPVAAEVEEEPFEESDEIKELLTEGVGSSADEGDGFTVSHVSEVFSDGRKKTKQEITTETLGDLYFSQEQFDKSLRIFEKLNEKYPSPELYQKINACRRKLGVQKDDLLRTRRIEVLRNILEKVRPQVAARHCEEPKRRGNPADQA